MEEGKALPISKCFNIAISLPCLVLTISLCKEGMGQEAQSEIRVWFVLALLAFLVEEMQPCLTCKKASCLWSGLI